MACLFSAGRTQLDLFDQSNNSDDTENEKICPRKKNYLKKGLSSSPNLKWVSYIVSVKLPPRELAP